MIKTRPALALGASLLLSFSSVPASFAAPTAPAHVSVNSGCEPGTPDTRHSNVKLTVEAPEKLDPTQPMTFTLRGEGYDESEPAARNGVYIMITTTDVWKIGQCSDMKGDGDALIADWIPAHLIKDGKFERTITVPGDTFKSGKSYSIGAAAAHGLVLTERYFDRGITITMPEKKAVREVPVPTNVRAQVDSRRNVTVNWDYPENIEGMEWRVGIECLEQCAAKFNTERSADKWKSSDREHIFDDADAGVYIAKVQTMLPAADGNGYEEGSVVTSEPFGVGDVKVPVYGEHPGTAPVEHQLPKGEWELKRTFSDVDENNRFYINIEWLAATGITTGYADGTFRPLDHVERAAMAAYFYRLAGSPEVSLPATSPFRDVAPDFPFYKEIVWMHQQGITTGWKDGTFRPHDAVNRDAMAAFFYRYAQKFSHVSGDVLPIDQEFADVSPTTQFHTEIMWMRKQGISTGWEDNTYRPWQPVERQAMAAFISRYELNLGDR
ncbi:MAG: S-layer homology domain-containing protein [Rothia sp. (in: high G+C Gram-positive bacteria)]|uniref:S-layer homology domain-containing protein n=1 Tax=Rothia sp. (in: high G+C Gram-positive bacteria) TaxID=1885016 RepID=UPI0026E1008E|nr:S-layer homology domain-containing protein [Rothia sp. (in: high G+C Gram-positive bacteria)]MDO5750070.1 S-layer homology domain-containing protein [Rothia sp. (in: high G+C Gram-positive bacteria)]